MIRQSTLTILQNKNHPRIWIEGKYLQQAGFHRGCKINIVWKKDRIEITSNNIGSHTVSSHRNNPIVDINNEKIKSIFSISEKIDVAVDFGKIIIKKSKTVLKKLASLKDRSCGVAFAGAGLMDIALKKSGFDIKWAIEKNKKYADIYQKNHPDVTVYNSDIADINYHCLQKVNTIVGSIPCEPYSVVNQTKTEIHETEDLSIFFLMLVDAINPETIVIEEVPRFVKSKAGLMTMQALKRMGYSVDYQIICGKDFGELEVRRRAVIIASTRKIDFPKPTHIPEITFADVLEKPDSPHLEWFDETTKPWLFRQWRNHKEKGNFFGYNIMINEDSKSTQAITKRYFNIQATSPIVRHPTKDLYRLLTVNEVKKIKGVPSDYDLTEFKTVAGECLGQGVLVRLFEKILYEIAKTQ